MRWVPWAVAAGVLALVIGLLTNRPGARMQTSASALPAAVYFDAGQATLNSDGRRTVAAVASSAKSVAAPIAVTGYTDPTGNPDQNLELAKNRANAVRDALVQEGVPASRVTMIPPASVTGSGPDQNARRVEITLAGADTGTLR